MAVTFTCDGIRSFTAKKSSVSSTAWNQTAYASTLSEGGQAGPHTTSGVNYVSVTVLRFAVPSISYNYNSYSFKIKFKYVSNLSKGAKGTVYFYLKDPTKTSGTNYQPVYDSNTGHYLTGTSDNKVIGSANFTLSNTNSQLGYQEITVTLHGNVKGASYIYAWFYGDDFLRNIGWTSDTSSMTAEGIRYVYYYANGGENNKDKQTVNATTGKSSLKRNIDTYWTDPTNANLDNVTNVFKRTGYWVKSASQAWRVNSATSTTYLPQDGGANINGYRPNLNLYANWAPKELTINFYANGSLYTTKTYTYDVSNQKFPRASITGYTHSGWNTNSNGSGTHYAKNAAVKNSFINNKVVDAKTNTISMYAELEKIRYTITLDKNGGSGGTSTIYLHKGVQWENASASRITSITKPTTAPTGKVFDGYYTSSGKQIIDSSGTIVGAVNSLSADTTLTAQWVSPGEYTLSIGETKTFTITSSTASGSSPGPSDSGVTKIKILGISEKGTYKFFSSNRVTVDPVGGLYTSSGLVIGTNDDGNGDRNFLITATDIDPGIYYLYVRGFNANTSGSMDVSAELVSLTPKTYTVYFTDPEGSIPNPTSKTVTQGSTYGTLATISKTGHNFNGWFTDNGTQITSSSTVNITEDQTLYAQWTPQTFTITFYDVYSTPNPSSKTVTYGDIYGDLAQTSRSGYNFDGWYTQQSGGSLITANTTVTTINDQTLYAHWSYASYTVYFSDPYGNTPNPTSKTVTNGSEYGTLASISREGYDFIGWFDGTSSDSVEILPTDIVNLTGNQTLYAKWQAQAPANHTIYYNVGSYGSGTGFTETSNGNSFTTAGAGYFTRSNYTQTGWSTSSSGSSKDYELNTTYPISGTLNLYPYWEYQAPTNINTYTLNVGRYVDITIPAATTGGYPSEDWNTVLSSGGFAFIIIEGVDSSGTYKFYSTNNSGDPCANLIDNDGGFIAKDDQSGGSSNFSIERNLDPGTYNLIVKEWSTGVSGTLRVYAEGPPPVSSDYEELKVNGSPKVARLKVTTSAGNANVTKDDNNVVVYKITNITTPGIHTFYSDYYNSTGPDPLASLWSVDPETDAWKHLLRDDSNGDVSKINNFKITWNIQAADLNKEYYLCVRNYNSANGTEGDVYIYATGPAAVTNYYVRFNGNGATGGTMSDQLHTHGVSQALTTNAFERKYRVDYLNCNQTGTGDSLIATYPFKNWNTQSNGSGNSYSNQQSVSNLTSTVNGIFNLYAQWNSGSITLPNISRQGYTLEGWYTGPFCEVVNTEHEFSFDYDPDTGYYVSNNKGQGGKTATAVIFVYTPQACTMYIDAINNGESIYDYGTFSALNDEGTIKKSFSGSTTGEDTSATISYSLTAGNIHYLYAKFIKDGGVNGKGDYLKFKIRFSTGSTKIGNPGASYTPTADMVIYPNWVPEASIYTISLSDSYGSGTSPTKLYLKYNAGWYSNSTATTSISSITCPTRTGYTFGGYYTESNGAGAQIIDSSGNIVSGNLTTFSANSTIYAKWTPIKYAINFNPGAGSGSMTAQEKTHGTAYTLPSCTFTAPSANVQNYTIALKNSDGTDYDTKTCTRTTPYAFNTWRLNSTSGTSYEVGSNYTSNAAATFYATWSAGTGSGSVSLGSIPNYSINQGYTVSFDGNGATNPASQSTTKKTDYTFRGWGTSQGTSTVTYNSTSNYAFTSDKTLYAVWNSSTTGTSSITLPSITRTGYNFLGWYKTTTGPTPTYSPSTISGVNYTFTYDSSTQTFSNNNNGISSSQAMCEITINASSACTMYVDVTHCGERRCDYGTFSVLNGTLPTGTAAATTYQKIYNNATSGTIINETLTYSLPAGISSIQVKFQKDGSVNKKDEGLSFKLRFSETTTEEKVGDAGYSYTPTENITLKAKWEIKKYAINFNPGAGSGSMAAQSKTHGTAYTLPSCGFTAPSSSNGTYSTTFYGRNSSSQTVEGTTTTPYIFNDWKLNSTSGTSYAVGSNYTTNANATFYATWSLGTTTRNAITFPAALSNETSSSTRTITFHPNNGTTVNKGTVDGIKTTTYKFSKWKSKTTNTEYSAGYSSYVPTNGEHFDATWTTSNSYSNITTPSASDVIREGYILSGWGTATNSTSGTAPEGTYNCGGQQTLYAIWTPITYEVCYNGNGNTSGSMSNSSHTYDSAKNLTANSFTKSYTVSFNSNGGTACSDQTISYSFKDWNTNQDGTGNSYNNQASVKNLTTTNNDIVNLYAQWNQANSITLPETTRKHYEFLGWYVADINPIYTISSVEGASYSFVENANGYYESNNKEVHNSAALCKVTINTDVPCTMFVDCINFAESNFDYGILSNIGQQLSLTNAVDATCYKSFKGSQSSSIQTVEYSLPAGESFIYIKFRKDTSINKDNDSLQFKLRFLSDKIGMAGDLYTPVNNTVLKAEWKKNVFTVNLDHQDGSNTINTLYVKTNDNCYSDENLNNVITSIDIPIKEGHTFRGYYTAPTSGTQLINSTGTILANMLTTVVGDMTIYARWTVNMVNISYRPYSTVTNPAYTAESESSYIRQVSSNTVYFHKLKYGESSEPYKASEFGLSKPGYAFTGWLVTGTKNTILDENTSYPSTVYISSSDPGKSTANATGFVNVLKAQWKPVGSVRINTASGFNLAMPYIYHNGNWQQSTGYVYTNGEWKQGS